MDQRKLGIDLKTAAQGLTWFITMLPEDNIKCLFTSILSLYTSHGGLLIALKTDEARVPGLRVKIPLWPRVAGFVFVYPEFNLTMLIGDILKFICKQHTSARGLGK